MKKQHSSRSAFFNPRFLISFAFCTIGVLLALVAFALYPGGNALARQNQSSVAVAELPHSTVPVLEARLSQQPPVDQSTSPDRAVDLPESGSVDLAALGVHPLPFPLTLRESPGVGPDSGAMGPGKAFMQMTNDIVNQSTGSAFAVLSTGWNPGEMVQGYVNGVLNFTFASGSFGTGTAPIGYLGVTFGTGAGFGYLTVEEKGVTSGRVTGGVVQVAPTGPYLPGLAGAPHAENTSGTSPNFLLFGTGYTPSTLATRYRNGVSVGTTTTGTAGSFFVGIAPANNGNTSAVWSYNIAAQAGSMNGTSIEERSDAGGPQVGDQNSQWAFVDRAVINSVTGGTFAVVGEGFTSGETVTISSCAGGTVTADGNGAASFFLTGGAGAGVYACVLTGSVSTRVARASVLADANSTNRRGLIVSPATMSAAAPTTFTAMADKLPASAPFNVYIDGVLQGTATTNTAGFASVLLTKPTPTPGFITHEVGWVVNPSATPDAQAAVFLLVPTGPSPTPTPTASQSPGCQNYAITDSIGAIVTGGTDTGLHADDSETTISLPFPITLYGNTYSTARAGSNGYLSFTLSAVNFYTGCLPNAAFSYTIFPWEVDQDLRWGTNGIFTLTTGTTPTRTFYVEWRNCQYGSETACLANSSVNYQIVFNENDPGNFSIVYGGTWGTADATVGAIGVQGSGVTQYTQSQCNAGRPAANRQVYTQCPPASPTPSGTPTPSPTSTATATATAITTPTPPVTPSPTATPTCITVLFDQTETPAAGAISSQEFEPASSAFDDFAADDFVVPGGVIWTIQKVEVSGIYFNTPPNPGGPSQSFNVAFYNNAGSLPGAVIGSAQLHLPYTCVGNCNATAPASTFTIYLASSVVLNPGTYWVSVQSSMDSDTGAQWGWSDKTTTSNSPAAWQNPNGGFASACNSWGARGATCGIDASAPDQIFRLLGCLKVGISGNVGQCSTAGPSGQALAGATMTLTGSSGGSTTTDATGFYAFSGLAPGGSYTVTPSKAARTVAQGGINTQDVIATQRHFLNITVLTGCRLTAANVNGDGFVNTQDVIAIQRFFLGLTSGIANVGKYSFTPPSRTYPNLVSDQTGQNYDAIVFGDVAAPFANPRPGGPDPDAPDAAGVSTVASVALPEITVDQSKSSFTAAVKTSEIDANSNLLGFQGDFTFDERVVTFESEPVQNAGLTANNWNVSGNVLPGAGPIRTLRVSAYSTDFAPLSGAGTLFELKMTKVSKAAQGTQLTWAPSPNQFIFIDANLKSLTVGNAAPGSVVIQ